MIPDDQLSRGIIFFFSGHNLKIDHDIFYKAKLLLMTFQVGTAFLWWTFLSNKSKFDREENLDIPFLRSGHQQ